MFESGEYTEKSALRIGAMLASLGAVVVFIADISHPRREDPSDHLRVFQEYVDSDTWIAVHMGQFFGMFFIFASLLLLAYSLTRQPGATAALAVLGFGLASASMGAAAILQGVDAITLKVMVDAWAKAPATQESLAFGLAESVRWLEIGLNSLFRLLQGVVFLVFGMAIVFSHRYPKWFGWIGVVCGAVTIVRGFAVADTGFALSNPVYAYSSYVLKGVLNVWMLALAGLMWRQSQRSQSPDARVRLPSKTIGV